MGRRSCPADVTRRIGLHRFYGRVRGWLPRARAMARASMHVSFRAAARAFLCFCLCLPGLIAATGAYAAGAAAAPAAQEPPHPPAGTPPDKMFVEASELRYDTVKNTVSAVGDARVYYKGRVLEADQVTYNRNTGRVLAQGHAKLTETDGSVCMAMNSI